jgi:hypothetical protein
VYVCICASPHVDVLEMREVRAEPVQVVDLPRQADEKEGMQEHERAREREREREREMANWTQESGGENGSNQHTRAHATKNRTCIQTHANIGAHAPRCHGGGGA